MGIMIVRLTNAKVVDVVQWVREYQPPDAVTQWKGFCITARYGNYRVERDSYPDIFLAAGGRAAVLGL